MATTTLPPTAPDAAAPSDATPVPDARIVPTAQIAEELGPRGVLTGNAQIGPSYIVHHPTRDTVVVFYQDGFEGEPSVGWICVLDGPTGKAYVVQGWDFTLTAEATALIYGVSHVVRDATEDPPKDLVGGVAKKLGLSTKAVHAAMFEDGMAGTARVVQPVVLDLDTGTRTPLKLVGGGTLALYDGGVVAVDKPSYYAFSSDVAEDPDTAPVPVGLDLAKKRWRSLTEQDRQAAKAMLTAEPPGWGMPDPIEAQLIAVTRDGKLGVVVVDASNFTVVPARLKPPPTRADR